MSWAEEQDWFGLEDLILDKLSEQNGIEYITMVTHIPAWRMSNGKLIAIRDMETSHIKNCIKMIHKSNGKWRPQYLRYFTDELCKRKFL